MALLVGPPAGGLVAEGGPRILRSSARSSSSVMAAPTSASIEVMRAKRSLDLSSGKSCVIIVETIVSSSNWSRNVILADKARFRAMNESAVSPELCFCP